jgi:hypothetical protein
MGKSLFHLHCTIQLRLFPFQKALLGKTQPVEAGCLVFSSRCPTGGSHRWFGTVSARASVQYCVAHEFALMIKRKRRQLATSSFMKTRFLIVFENQPLKVLGSFPPRQLQHPLPSKVAKPQPLVTVHAEVYAKRDAGVSVFVCHFNEGVERAGRTPELRPVLVAVVGEVVIEPENIGQDAGPSAAKAGMT